VDDVRAPSIKRHAVNVRTLLLAALLAACGPGSGPMKPNDPIQNTSGTGQGTPEQGGPRTGGGDRDGDGIADVADMCPEDPEDFDGFQDQDGCPDPDNDQDGIRDIDDQCPNEPEVKNGQTDDDGCPP
jgi:hypothetical protein